MKKYFDNLEYVLAEKRYLYFFLSAITALLPVGSWLYWWLDPTGQFLSVLDPAFSNSYFVMFLIGFIAVIVMYVLPMKLSKGKHENAENLAQEFFSKTGAIDEERYFEKIKKQRTRATTTFEWFIGGTVLLVATLLLLEKMALAIVGVPVFILLGALGYWGIRYKHNKIVVSIAAILVLSVLVLGGISYQMLNSGIPVKELLPKLVESLPYRNVLAEQPQDKELPQVHEPVEFPVDSLEQEKTLGTNAMTAEEDSINAAMAEIQIILDGHNRDIEVLANKAKELQPGNYLEFGDVTNSEISVQLEYNQNWLNTGIPKYNESGNVTGRLESFIFRVNTFISDDMDRANTIEIATQVVTVDRLKVEAIKILHRIQETVENAEKDENGALKESSVEIVLGLFTDAMNIALRHDEILNNVTPLEGDLLVPIIEKLQNDFEVAEKVVQITKQPEPVNPADLKPTPAFEATLVPEPTATLVPIEPTPDKCGDAKENRQDECWILLRITGDVDFSVQTANNTGMACSLTLDEVNMTELIKGTTSASLVARQLASGFELAPNGQAASYEKDGKGNPLVCIQKLLNTSTYVYQNTGYWDLSGSAGTPFVQFHNDSGNTAEVGNNTFIGPITQAIPTLEAIQKTVQPQSVLPITHVAQWLNENDGYGVFSFSCPATLKGKQTSIQGIEIDFSTELTHLAYTQEYCINAGMKGMLSLSSYYPGDGIPLEVYTNNGLPLYVFPISKVYSLKEASEWLHNSNIAAMRIHCPSEPLQGVYETDTGMSINLANVLTESNYSQQNCLETGGGYLTLAKLSPGENIEYYLYSAGMPALYIFPIP